MKVRTVLIGSTLVALIGVGGWWAWRSYTTPAIPDIPLEAAPKPVAAAIEAAREEVRKNPRSGAAWGKLGMVLAANGFFAPAETCFGYAARFEPTNPRWPYLQAAHLDLLGRPPQIMSLMRRSLDLTRDKDDQDAIRFRIVILLIEEGELDEASRLVDELRAANPADPRVQYGLGLIAVARDDRPAAREYLARVTDHPSARKRALILLATLASEDKKLARSYHEQAERLPRDQPWPASHDMELARYRVEWMVGVEQYTALEREGRTTEALLLLQQLAEESPNTEVYFSLGFRLYKAREFEKAATAFRQALGFDAKHAKSYLFLGAALLSQGEKRLREPDGTNDAMEFFRQAVAAEDQSLAIQNHVGHAHLVRGQALKHLGRTDDAFKALREAVLCQPESAEMHLVLGEALAEAGQITEAIKHLEDAVSVATPNDPRPRAALEKWRAKAKNPP